MLGLVIPEEAEDKLFGEFIQLRSRWSQRATEMKGSRLDEAKIATVVDLLAAHGAFVEYYAIDMSLHCDEVVNAFKERQAAALTENLTPLHAEELVRSINDDADAIRKLSNQLFVQAYVTIILVLDLLPIAINYFAQRKPAELGRFTWTIDRKDRETTSMERLWATHIMPFGQARSVQFPVFRVKGFDYPFLSKYEIDEYSPDEKAREHLQWMKDALSVPEDPIGRRSFLDIKRILTDERAFRDSKDNIGLQLADICATTICRALNGNLQPAGWGPIAKLLIRKLKLPFIQFDNVNSSGVLLEPRARTVWRVLDHNSQSLFL